MSYFEFVSTKATILSWNGARGKYGSLNSMIGVVGIREPAKSSD
ncbi:hypothetical protein [Lentilactobacillus parabuchneri]